MGPFAFGNPLLLWGLAAVAVPVAVHLLSRRRSRQMAFAAVEFILRAQKRTVRHVRLRQILLLLSRIAIILAVALALAKPMFAPDSAAAAAVQTQAAATAIVVDGSLSMRYRLDGKTLFQRAQELGKDIIQRLPDEASATLVLCDGRAVDVQPPGFDRAALVRRLSDAQPSYQPANVTGCMAAAARALGESPLEGKKIYVVGDLTSNSLRLDAPAPQVPTPAGDVLPDVVFVDAAGGAALPNVAITDIAVGPSAALGARGFEVAATVRNSGDEPVKNRPIALEIDGNVVTRGFVDVPARGSARKVLAHRFEPGHRLGRVVLDPDALAEDDARPFVLKVAREVRALVVDGAPSAIRHQGESFFVDAALGPGRSGGRITTTFVDADAAQTRTLEDFDVVLLLNLAAPRSAFVETLERFVNSGGGLFLSVGDHVDPDAWNAALGRLLPRRLHLVRTAAEPDAESGPPPARFARVDLRHPAFRVFEGATEGFDTARIWRYVMLVPEASPGERVLASLDDGSPLIVEAPKGKGRVVLYASTVDRDWTDWPIRTSFLPAIQQLTAYLADGLTQAPPPPVRVGDVASPALPEGWKLDGVVDDTGRALSTTTLSSPGHFTPRVSDAAGKTGDAKEYAFAAVLDPYESDTSRHDPDTLAAHFGGNGRASVTANASGAIPTNGTPLWSWLLAGGVLFFLAEGLLVRRA